MCEDSIVGILVRARPKQMRPTGQGPRCEYWSFLKAVSNGKILHVRTGILRNKFWIRLEGSCDAVFDEYHLLTSADWRKDISPGATLKVTGCEPDSRTQTFIACPINSERRIGLQEERFTDKTCPVNKPIRAAAGINRIVRSGWVSVERNSDRIRQSLLLELVARSVKIILRRASLQAAEMCGYNSEESFKDIAVRPCVTYF